MAGHTRFAWRRGSGETSLLVNGFCNKSGGGRPGRSADVSFQAGSTHRPRHRRRPQRPAARLLGERLTEALGKQVIVDNRGVAPPVRTTGGWLAGNEWLWRELLTVKAAGLIPASP